MHSSSLVIAKFGGTSVADYQAMSRCVNIVKNNPACRLVVTSAPAGITNLLVALGQGGLSAEQTSALVEEIQIRSTAISDNLPGEVKLNHKLSGLISEIENLSFNEELSASPPLQDELLSYGERIASLLLTACLNHDGVESTEFDVREVMATNDNFGAAEADTERLAQNCQQNLLPLVRQKVVVTQGFIGKSDWGDTTTLGRGGSDYTAALLAEALVAQRCEIWTDVAGVFSTDPRIVASAFPLPELSYDEAAEMANFGAKVLHPSTLAPTLRHDIPVFIGSTREPDLGGGLP